MLRSLPFRASSRHNVRLWHKADVQTALMNVRFEVNNGHDADVARCLLMTHSGRFSVLVMELSRVLAVGKLDSNCPIPSDGQPDKRSPF
jgi:hypothetical protein